jgi:hypothetical protein
MDPVSNTDRIVRLIRQRMEERSKATASSKGQKVAHPQARGRAAIPAITGELNRAGAADGLLRRVLVEQLLVDQFGPALVNDARFQQIVDQVTEAMMSDRVIGSLISQAVNDLQTVSP